MTNEVIGINFLKQIFTLLNTKLSFEKFLTSLKLTSSNEMISNEDFKDWLDSLGFKVKTSQSIQSNFESSKPHNQVLDKIKSSFTKPDQFPTRKTIDSAWLSSPFQPSYFSATFLTASQLIKEAPLALNKAGEVIAGSFSLAKYALYIGIPIAAWFIWTNRTTLSTLGMNKIARKLS